LHLWVVIIPHVDPLRPLHPWWGEDCIPYAIHAMLAHRWRKLSICWWRDPKTFRARGRNTSTR
jgi:hypothetical protein